VVLSGNQHIDTVLKMSLNNAYIDFLGSDVFFLFHTDKCTKREGYGSIYVQESR